ncbi:MAG: hypothetical protein K8J31_09450 [Anaerolineae bacterium]|nr:hypothetical protein [Anaerolineae bacterium]
MSRRVRLTLFLTLLAVLLALVPSALAQETFGLSAEDFALFSSPNMDADSLAFNFSVDLNVTGAPDGAVAIALTGTGAVGTDSAGMPVADITLTGNADTPDGSSPVNVELRVVDGILYFNLGDGSGWVGQPLDEMMSGLSSLSPIPLNPSELASGDMTSDPEAAAAIGEVMSALSEVNPSDYIGIARLDDMSGQAHFQVNVDVSGFLSSDAFTQLMTTAGSMSGDDSVASMAPMLAMMFQNMSLTFDQFMGLEDNRVSQGVLNFAMSINPAMMGASDTDAQPVDVSFKLDVNSIQYNPEVSVTAPEDAMMMPSGTSGS